MLREAHRVRGHHSQREDLSVSLSSSFVSKERDDLLEKGRDDLLSDTNFKPLSTEERNWVKLLNLKKKNFTMFELKKFNEEINSFFKDGSQ